METEFLWVPTFFIQLKKFTWSLTFGNHFGPRSNFSQTLKSQDVLSDNVELQRFYGPAEVRQMDE